MPDDPTIFLMPLISPQPQRCQASGMLHFNAPLAAGMPAMGSKTHTPHRRHGHSSQGASLSAGLVGWRMFEALC